jgi:hypothetical protein
MRKNAVVFSFVATALLATFGMGHAIAQDEHDHQHPSASADSSQKTSKPATDKASGQPRETSTHEGTMDMKAMCDMHRQMMSKGSPADREAMADKEMKGMSAEQKQQHMKMMDEQCK